MLIYMNLIEIVIYQHIVKYNVIKTHTFIDRATFTNNLKLPTLNFLHAHACSIILNSRYHDIIIIILYQSLYH